MNKKKALVLYCAEALQSRREYLRDTFFSFFTNSFDCVFVDSGCNLAAEVEKHGPDIIVYSGPLESTSSPFYRIPQNASCRPHIPRIGFIQSDDHSPLWFASCNLLLRLGCQAVFTAVPFIKEKLPPDLARAGYYYNKGFDEAIYHERHLTRDIPIGLIGAGFCVDESYPWRRMVFDKLAGNAPLFVTGRPHLESVMPILQQLEGESYAHLLGRCQLAFACGGQSESLVAKFFEIPAAGACLVCPDIPIVREAGFEDMQNAVFVDEHNLIEKLNHLFANPQRIQEIASAGYDLVHSRYTNTKMNILAQWLELHQSLKADEVIIQPNLLQPLQIARGNATVDHFQSNAHLHRIAKQGFAMLLEDDIREAHAQFEAVLTTVSYDPRGKLGRAIVLLRSGRPREALTELIQSIGFIKANGGLAELCDPVDLAYYMICLHCLGQHKRAHSIRSEWMPHTRHPALAAAQAYTHFFNTGERDYPINGDADSANLLSHYPYAHTCREWMAILEKSLAASIKNS